MSWRDLIAECAATEQEAEVVLTLTIAPMGDRQQAKVRAEVERRTDLFIVGHQESVRSFDRGVTPRSAAIASVCADLTHRRWLA